MANDLYEILSSTPSVEFIPPNKTRPVRILTVQALESGVIFFTTVKQGDFATSHINLIAHDLAVGFNTLAGKPGVIGVDVQEDVSPSNRYHALVVVTVESTSGDSEADVTLTWGEALGTAGYRKVATARAQLDAVEDL